MAKFFIIPKLLIVTLLLIANNQTNPYYLMNNLAIKTFTRLKNEQQKIHQNTDYLRAIVHEELLPYVQIEHASKSMLGKHYNEITKEQYKIYLKAFKNYLEQIYSQTLAFYTNQTYEITEKKTTKNTIIIPIRVTIFDKKNTMPICLDFQWRKNNITKTWQIYDVITEGISLIEIKKNEWASTLNKNGIDELTRQLIIAANKPIILRQFE